MIFPPRFNGRQRGGLFNGVGGPFSKRWQDGAAAAGDGSLADIIASAVFDLDVTQAASYSGGTTWANLVTAPADGSAQTAYDFFTGDGSTSSTYPTFNGSAGSAAAYWSFDGGDNFRLKSGTNTAFLNNISRTDNAQDWWYAATIQYVDNATTQVLCGTSSGAAANNGVLTELRDADVRERQRGSGSAIATLGTNLGSGEKVILVSHSHTNNMTRIWINSTTASEIAHTYTSLTADAANSYKIGSGGANASPLLTGSRMYSFAMGNEYIDNTKAAAIIAALEARHSRDYTP